MVIEFALIIPIASLYSIFFVLIIPIAFAPFLSRIKAAIEDASNSTSRKWEDLPINCLVLIFKKVEIPCLTLSVPFVCKAWYEASLDPACWKVLNLCTTDLHLPDSCFAEDFKCAYYVNKFRLRDFLKFLIRRSNNSATQLLTGDIYITLHNKNLLYEEYVKNSAYRIFFCNLNRVLDPT